MKENFLTMKDLGVLSPKALVFDFKALEFDLKEKAPINHADDSDDALNPAVTSALATHNIFDMSKEQLEEFSLAHIKGYDASNTRAAKYKRFYKQKKGQSSRSMNRKWYKCHKMGHYKSGYPKLSTKQR